MTTTTATQAPRWGARAERLLEQAVGEVRDHIDAIPSVSAALAALRIEVGELPAEEMDGFPFPGETAEPDCICPADLLERGGFRGGCPAHAAVRRYDTGEG